MDTPLRAHLGGDQGTKKTDLRQFTLAAQRQTVTASGTINRGRGVYFKLCRSRRQILEGDKTFHLIFRVPDDWRGSLLDVSVLAQSKRRTLAGLDEQIVTMGQSDFVIAAYRQGDTEAASISEQLADAEQTLRQLASEQTRKPDATSLSGILRRIAIKLEFDSAEDDSGWIWRLLAGDSDPYLDREIQRLPPSARAAAVDYCEIRGRFKQLASSPVANPLEQVSAHQ